MRLQQQQGSVRGPHGLAVTVQRTVASGNGATPLVACDALARNGCRNWGGAVSRVALCALLT